MAAPASDWLRHFRLLLWNRWREIKETWQEARSYLPLPSLCFSGRWEKQNGRSGLWLAETFSTSSLKPLNGIQRNLTGSKISTSSTKFVFFGSIGKTRWPPWPLIGWDIFDFSSEIVEGKSKKLDRKQDLIFLYQVCVFRADGKNKMAALASDWLRHFQLLLWNRWMEFNETWQDARSQRLLQSLCFSGRSEKQDGGPGFWLAETFSTSSLKLLKGIQWNLTGSKTSMSSTKFVFFGPIGKTRWPLWPLIGWEIFDFFSETTERNSMKVDRKQDLNVFYQICVLSGQSEKQDVCPGLWLAETFSPSSLKLLKWIQWNLTGSKTSTSSTKFVFFGPIGKTRWPLWPLIGWEIFDFFSETTERNSIKLDRKQDLNVLYQICVLSGRSEKQDVCPGLWLPETFSTSSLKPLNRNQRNLTGSKILSSSTKFVFFRPIRKTWWLPWPLIGWDIFDFFSETTERNSMKLDRKQDLKVLYQVCVLLGWSEKQDGRPGLWLAEKFLTSSLKPLNGIQRNLTGCKISTSSTKFVFFGSIWKTRWLPWPLIGWNIFDFFSETTERNSMKLDRKQDLNVLYQVCVFRADRKNKMAALASDWLRNFRLLLWNYWKEFNKIGQEARPQCPLPNLCFIGSIGKTRCLPWPLIAWDIFDFFSETAEQKSKKLDRKQDLIFLCKVCVFQADQKNRMAALASDWLRHFRLLLWNYWKEFNVTWQEARPQRPLPSLCFSGRSEKQNVCPGLWLPETFSTSSLKQLNRKQRNLTGSKNLSSSTKFVFFGPIRKTRWPPWPLIGWDIFDFFSETTERIQWNLTGSKTSTSSTKFVFFGPIGKTRWLLWPLIGWEIFDFFSETAEWNSTKPDRMQDLNVLNKVCVFRVDRKNKMSALASDWLRHFRLLLWNYWKEFNETWQEARPQRPLPSLCFSGRSEK